MSRLVVFARVGDFARFRRWIFQVLPGGGSRLACNIQIYLNLPEWRQALRI